jgi:predicted FMN-binding regulatory protein PaiB
MNSTLDLGTTNPDAVLTVRADERLTHAYEQIARADEQLARVTEQLSKMERDAARRPSVVLGRPPARGRPVLRGFVGLVLAGCIAAAAFAWQSSYGEAARLTLAQWAPQLISTSPLWLAKPGNFAQPSPSTVQLAAVEATPAQPTPQMQTEVQSPAQNAASAPAQASPELTQLLQGMAHDLAIVEQGIEQLKASQERTAADQARTIEQLKANQEQMARLVAKSSDAKSSDARSSDAKSSEKPSRPDPRAKTPAPPPQPVANAAHKPPPSQARARPQPVQLQPDKQ